MKNGEREQERKRRRRGRVISTESHALIHHTIVPLDMSFLLRVLRNCQTEFVNLSSDSALSCAISSCFRGHFLDDLSFVLECKMSFLMLYCLNVTSHVHSRHRDGLQTELLHYLLQWPLCRSTSQRTLRICSSFLLNMHASSAELIPEMTTLKSRACTPTPDVDSARDT